MAVGNVTLYAANIDDLRLQDLVGAPVRLALLEGTPGPSAGAPTIAWDVADVLARQVRFRCPVSGHQARQCALSGDRLGFGLGQPVATL